MKKNQLFLINDEVLNLLAQKITEQLSAVLSKKLTVSEDPILTISQLSELLSMTKGSIYQLVHKKIIPHHKKGRLYFIKSEILDWVKNGKRETTSSLHDKANDYIIKNSFQ